MDKARFFREKCRLKNEALLAELDAAATEKMFRPKTYITKPGRRPDEVWFLVDGVVCFCRTDGSGKEAVDLCISQPGLVSNAILFEYTSMFGEKTLRNTTVLAVPHEKVRVLLEMYPEFSAMWLCQIKLYTLKYWKLRMVCANMTIAERVQWYEAADPVSFSSLNNTQMASFLGTSRELISRAKMHPKKDIEHYDIPGKGDAEEIFRRRLDALSRFEDSGNF